MKCLNCSSPLPKNRKYCSNACQSLFSYAEYIKKWKNGDTSGNRGIVTKNLSAHIIRYVRNKYQNKCAVCEWGAVNTFSGLIPTEIDHIDGNANNNSEENLRLLCPNCHSLTSTFRNLNKNSGRAWRRQTIQNKL